MIVNFSDKHTRPIPHRRSFWKTINSVALNPNDVIDMAEAILALKRLKLYDCRAQATKFTLNPFHELFLLLQRWTSSCHARKGFQRIWASSVAPSVLNPFQTLPFSSQRASFRTF